MKDHLRDYATEAYRYYARCGRPSYEELRQIIFDAALESSRREIVRVKGIGNPTQQAIINAERAVEEMEGQLLDVKAVEKALKTMRPEWRRAVEIVYFAAPKKPLEHGDIERRVHRAELEIPADRSTIYRWLRKARRAFATERKLRL
jgi:hypothetical protein